ncbi:MAG TPA: SMP-30/gluconolactonase/LRE family protein [Burkholderiales bacterium]|nr:SMP-30/gluconolactonase/LRE family protein [Burkholderiales bacterium]
MLLLASPLVAGPALADDDGHQFPKNTTFSTLIKTPLAIEGLTSDNRGNLYVPGRRSAPDMMNCPVWRIDIDNPALVEVGFIPGPCSPSGLAFDRAGRLYVTEGDKIYRFYPDAAGKPLASVFATGVPGANGVAFDEDGNLWTGDGTTGQGRVWRIDSSGTPTEMFRIQPMANEVNGAVVVNVGRDARTLPPGTITVTATGRSASNTLGSQPLVANGVAFDDDGDLIVADTARGALWKVKFRHDGTVRSRMGCDTTFTANTLCLENIFVAHPLLEGADGIALDRAGNIWVDANERNAVVVVTRNGKDVREVFRNAPDAVTQLRNGGPLEFNTSPVLEGRKFCTSNSDGNRRDNSPSSAGEIPGGGFVGKISCMDQRLSIPGMRLPVR